MFGLGKKKQKHTGIEFMMNKFDNMLLLDTIPDSQVCSCQLHGKGKGKV